MSNSLAKVGKNQKTNSKIGKNKPCASENIIMSAAKLFAKKSFLAVTINDIANSAKVSKANVFYHFKSKEELFAQVVEKFTTPMIEFIENVLQKKISSCEKLWLLIENYIVNEHNEIDIFVGLLEHSLAYNKNNNFGECESKSLICGKTGFYRNIDAINQIFLQGQKSGEFRQDINSSIAAFILGAVTNFYNRRRKMVMMLSPVKPFSKADFAQKIYLYLVAGIVSPQYLKKHKMFVPKIKSKSSIVKAKGSL